MIKQIILALLMLAFATLACGESTPEPPLQPIPTLAVSLLDTKSTVYGFFPSPPEVSIDAVFKMYRDLGEHADVVLLQQPIDWIAFARSEDAESSIITDIHNQFLLAHQHGLDVIFVVDPLNGLNRREFMGLPFGWDASFANPQVRAAFTNYTLRIVREFEPRYLGLASEINTYGDAHPEDFPHYVSLYKDVYAQVKAVAPETDVFVTFQWEDLNNLIPTAAEGREAYDTNWEMVEVFEPALDLWVISSYPFVTFSSASQIPPDHYTPLLTRTNKPLAVAEGGYSSQPIGPISATPQDQMEYLDAIHDQIGERLSFWIYLILNDLNMDSYNEYRRKNGQGKDAGTLGMFAHVGLRTFDGTPKPALAVWDDLRSER